MTVKILIADDEPQLLLELDRLLRLAWPGSTDVLHAANGIEALNVLEREQPQVAFLDIRMPGLNGLEVARQLPHACHVVFVTAYDQYAVDAFEQNAVDYLLKPVREDRLQHTVQRLQDRLDSPVSALDVASLVERVSQLIKPAPASPLRWLQASIGESIRLIATDEVLYLRSEEKYTMVRTADGEFPIRTPLRELEGRLDGDHFWRIHRNCVVNVRYVQSITRDLRGRLSLALKGSTETLIVSRAHAQQFRPL